MRTLDRIVYAAAAALFVAFLVFCEIRAGQKPAPLPEGPEEHLTHADTYYWFGMAGRGSMAALSAAAKQAQLAADKLAESTLTGPERANLAARIAAKQKDIRSQQVLHSDTFHGVFAWSHFMAKPTLFRDAHATGSFELLDQPEVTASRNAIADLIDSVLNSLTTVAQHDVVFVTDPADFPANDSGSESLAAQLENEALYLFNLNPRFFVHNMLEVAAALSAEEQGRLRSLNPTARMLEKMRSAWGHRDILVVRLKKLDEVNRHHLWTAQGRLFRGTDPEPAVVYNNYGLCRDRTHMLGGVVAFNVMMLLLSIVVFRFLSGLAAYDRVPADWKTAAGLGVAAFLWGRVSVWGLIELVEPIVPEDETLAIVSFWWPALTGLVVLLGPGLVMRFAEERFGWLSRTFGTWNRGGALFATTTLGSATYVAQSALWVRTWSGWSAIPPLLIAAVAAAWIVGRALDPADSIRKKWGVVMLLLGLLIGLAFSHSYPKWEHLTGLWFTAIPIAVVACRAVLQSGHVVTPATLQSSDEEGSADPAELSTLLLEPPFHETQSCRDALVALEPWCSGRTVRLQLIGSAGVGKSALLREFQRRLIPDGHVANLVGVCPEPQEGAQPEPYRPFADAIAEQFSVNPLLPAESQVPSIDKAIDGIFEEVVPFSDLLFPPTHGGAASSGSQAELFRSVAIMLRQLARKNPVLLIVDDAHWIDEGSAALLRYLLDDFEAGGTCAIAIIVAAREPLAGFAEAETISVTPPDAEGIAELLTSALGFRQDVASELAAAVADEDGNLHWLFQILHQLHAGGVLQSGPDGIGWAAGTRLSDYVPDDFANAVRGELQRHTEFQPVLECAACVGRQFTVDVVSQSLERSRVETIRLLDRIEAETGFVRDLKSEDDTYEFRSPFLLEVLRELLEVNANGPRDPSPQRIRECHSQIAAAWESTLQGSSSALFRLATHRYAAGARHASRAVDEILAAADAACGQFEHDAASRYVAMARECAAACGRVGDDLEQQILLIEARTAHAGGGDRLAAADRLREWIRSRPQAPAEVYLAATRACYDAGVDTQSQERFADAAELAARTIERFEDPLVVAEALQFHAISLPPHDAAARQSRLEESLRKIDEAGESTVALRLRSRVLNSLAEQLSRSGDRSRAQSLFEQSIQLKTRPEIRDVSGLAMAHGGLGRLYFYTDEPDYDAARHHFELDLKYCHRTGNRIGEAKMHSMLAGCDLGQRRFESAAEHYQHSLDLAVTPVDRYFALAGLIETHVSLGQSASVNLHGSQLADAVREAEVPEFCQSVIRAALDRASEYAGEGWYDVLLSTVGRPQD